MRQPRRLTRSLPAVVALALAGAAMYRESPIENAGASRLAGIIGPGSTGVTLVNLDSESVAHAVVDFYPQGGGAPVSRALEDLQPHRYYSIYSPAETGLSNGAYAAIISSDRRITTLTGTGWSPYGGGALHGDIEPATAVLVPWVAKHAAGSAGETSLISIQNINPSAATVATLDLMASGSTRPSASAMLPIGPGASVTVDLAKHPGFAGVPDGFAGWARASAAGPLAVVAYTDFPALAMSVFAVEGIPEHATATVLAAPMVLNGLGSLGSSIAVLNPATAAVDVAVTYSGIGGTCAGQSFAHDLASVGAGGVATFHQSDVPMPGTGRSHLPPGCAAAARITSTGPVAALVRVADPSPPPPQRTIAAYGARRVDQAGRQLLLPLLRRNFYGTSDIQVVNASDAAATVTLEYADARDASSPFGTCGSPCRVVLPPGGGHRWEMAGLNGFADRSYGIGRIASDQPVLATVYQTNINSYGDRSGNSTAYSGTALDAAAPATGSRRHIPLLLRTSGDPAPTRTPAPATPWPTATPHGVFSPVGSSALMVTNLSESAAADIAVDFSSQTGGSPATIASNGVAPGGTAYLDLSRIGTLEDGVYAARVRASQPVAAVARTDWSPTADRAVNALMYNAPEAGTDLQILRLVKPYSGPASIVSFQNTSGEATTAVLRLMKVGETRPIATLLIPLGAHAATTFSLGAHPQLAQVPNNLDLWARVTADEPVAVLMTQGERTNFGVTANAGRPAGSAAATWVAPMVFRGFRGAPGGLDSGILVHNPGPSPVSVTVSYRGAEVLGRANACQSRTIEHNGGTPVSIPAGASIGFGQSSTASRGAGPSGLPENCAASAVIEASGGDIIASVGLSGLMSSSYSAIALNQGSRRVHLPDVRRQTQPMTLIQVQNLGTSMATVTLAFKDDRGRAVLCRTDCGATIPPLASRLWWLGDMFSVLPDNFSGSALVTSDQPVAAVASGISLISPVDLPIGGTSYWGIVNMVAYRGLADTGRAETALPLLLKNGRISAVAPVIGPDPSLVGGSAFFPVLRNR